MQDITRLQHMQLMFRLGIAQHFFRKGYWILCSQTAHTLRIPAKLQSDG